MMLVDVSALPHTLALQVRLRVAEDQLLPAFLGSALHGALGRALWKTVCAFRSRTECRGCPLFARCAYPALFATVAPRSEVLTESGIADQAPRPMLLAPEPGWTRPSGRPRYLAKDTEVPFRLTLLGRARDDFALVIVALKELAERGIGRVSGGASRGRAPMILESVISCTEEDPVYDARTGVIRAPRDSGAPVYSEPNDKVTIEAVTPLRLKRMGHFVSRPSPADFFRTLARRANTLAVLYGSGKRVVNEETAAEKAQHLEILRTDTRLVCVRRYSARQEQKMVWPGIVGQFQWRGPELMELWPLLCFGQEVQVGKGATLGFGRYMLASPMSVLSN